MAAAQLFLSRGAPRTSAARVGGRRSAAARYGGPATRVLLAAGADAQLETDQFKTALDLALLARMDGTAHGAASKRRQSLMDQDAAYLLQQAEEEAWEAAEAGAAAELAEASLRRSAGRGPSGERRSSQAAQHSHHRGALRPEAAAGGRRAADRRAAEAEAEAVAAAEAAAAAQAAAAEAAAAAEEAAAAAAAERRHRPPSIFRPPSIDVEASESLKEAANAAQAEVVRERQRAAAEAKRAAEEAGGGAPEREVEEVRAAGTVGLRFDPLSTDGHHYSDSVRKSLPAGLPPTAIAAALASPPRESRRPRRASATVVDAAPNVGLRFDPLSVDGHHYSDSVRHSLPHGLPPPLPVGSMVGIGADPLPPSAPPPPADLIGMAMGGMRAPPRRVTLTSSGWRWVRGARAAAGRRRRRGRAPTPT